MAKEVLKKFGRYFLLDQIAQGGMAEIYRARLAAADGAGRLIVIKRIQAGYGANSEFLQMFRSEIKVTMGFNHPNIVQLYDYGEEQSQPYIAMELVDGKNLRQFIGRANESKQKFPVELAAHIIEQAASGLHYAHTFKDKISGKHLNIIHRDISPQNVLISYDGNVKVIDFGIAKASTNSEATRAGVIKGKPSYLSPEQISGENLDARSDVFALGIVLWELLAGKKLFPGENDLAILKLIESCQTHVKPPSTVNSNVPKELDYIVLKALAKQPEKRYQTAEEFQRALHRFLYAFSAEFNPGDLSYYAKDLFKDEIVEDRKLIQKLNDKVEQLLSLELAPAKGAAQSDSEATMTMRVRGANATGSREVFDMKAVEKVQVVQTGPLPAAPARPRMATNSTGSISIPRQSTAHIQAPKKGGRLSFVGAAAAVIAAVFVASELGVQIPYLSEVMDEKADKEASLVLEGDHKNAEIMIDGKRVAQGLPATIKKLPAGRALRLIVKSPTDQFERELMLRGGENRVLSVKLQGLAVAEAPRKQARTPAAGKGVLLHLQITPGGLPARVEINGEALSLRDPSIDVPLDSPLELVIDRPGFRPFRREFVVSSQQVGAQKEWMMEVQLEPLSFGFLSIRTSPSAEAHITIDGHKWVKKTPFQDEKMPVGTYNIRLVNDLLGMEKVVTVNIQQSKVINLEEKLEIRN
ncbi:MAG: hypothetical protein A2X94_17350 [Bdellovibrionales bacterium GWB1_55_8]|nr:MAG: hypothetical protein A2X94_17350 [Bdellovibrionales bacterium GWB1_55_8]